MSDSVAVPGDGVLTFPGPSCGACAMTSPSSMDISPNFGALLMNEAASGIQLSNNNARQGSQLANAALQAQMVEDAREVGLLEGRTASGVLATPLASPVKTS